jgi:hypothetical protein
MDGEMGLAILTEEIIMVGELVRGIAWTSRGEKNGFHFLRLRL